MKSIAIPFSGFYESEHNTALDNALIQLCDIDGRGDFDPRLSGDDVQAINGAVNWPAAFEHYARAYVDGAAQAICDQAGSDAPPCGLVFDELDSPREYNFATDRIFCKVSDEFVAWLYEATPPGCLAERVRERFTSRDGFASSYPSEVIEWPPLAEWDHNQLGTLLEAWLGYEFGEVEGGYSSFTGRVWDNINDTSPSAADEAIKSAMGEAGWTIINKLEG